jgi:hypothetical protein
MGQIAAPDETSWGNHNCADYQRRDENADGPAASGIN